MILVAKNKARLRVLKYHKKKSMNINQKSKCCKEQSSITSIEIKIGKLIETLKGLGCKEQSSITSIEILKTF